VRRLFGAFALAGLAIVATATPAFAHAEFETSEPAANATLPAGEPPAAVTLDFSEGVQLPDDAIRLIDASEGTEVEGVGDATHGDSDSVVTATLPALDDGDYVVDWHVVSQDSHPIEASFTFTVGESDTDSATITGLLESDSGHGVGITFGLVRALAFGSVLVLVGAIVFLRVLVPAAGSDPSVRATLWISWLVAFVTAFAGIGLQAAYTANNELSEAWDPDAIGDVLDTPFGQWWAARIGLLLIALLAIRKPEKRRPPFVLALEALLGLGLLLTFTAAGHARTGRWVGLAYVTDLTHLGAAAVWLGGLAVLVALVARRHPSPDGGNASARFSVIAAPAIAVVAVTGTIQGWRQTGELEALFDTTYGRLLLTKIIIVVFIVAAASVSRHIVRSWRARNASGPDDVEAGDFRNAIVVEIALAALVLSVTAVLVNTEPARVAQGSEAPSGFEQTLTAEEGDLTFDLSITPATTGPNDVVVAITRDGDGIDVVELRATATLQDGDISPVDLDFTSDGTGPGAYAAAANFPLAGRWTIEIRATYTEVDQAVVTAEVDIT
jgi:copper transport protein